MSPLDTLDPAQDARARSRVCKIFATEGVRYEPDGIVELARLMLRLGQCTARRCPVRLTIMITLAWGLLGCGDSSGGSQVAASANEIRSYQGLAEDVESAASDYASAAGSRLNTVDACNDIHDAYEARVRPRLSDMLDMGGSMDRFMDEHEGAAFSDLHCAAEAMLDELDHHASVACEASTLDADRAEVMRHSDAMLRYAGHAWNRCDEMLDAIDSPVMWGAMMDGCRADESQFCDGAHHFMGGEDELHHHGMMDGTMMCW